MHFMLKQWIDLLKIAFFANFKINIYVFRKIIDYS